MARGSPQDPVVSQTILQFIIRNSTFHSVSKRSSCAQRSFNKTSVNSAGFPWTLVKKVIQRPCGAPAPHTYAVISTTANKTKQPVTKIPPEGGKLESEYHWKASAGFSELSFIYFDFTGMFTSYWWELHPPDVGGSQNGGHAAAQRYDF